MNMVSVCEILGKSSQVIKTAFKRDVRNALLRKNEQVGRLLQLFVFNIVGWRVLI